MDAKFRVGDTVLVAGVGGVPQAGIVTVVEQNDNGTWFYHVGSYQGGHIGAPEMGLMAITPEIAAIYERVSSSYAALVDATYIQPRIDDELTVLLSSAVDAVLAVQRTLDRRHIGDELQPRWPLVKP